MDDQQSSDFGTWLGRQLRRTGINQTDLAAQLGLTRAAVSAWITGRAEPREEVKRRIAAILGTDTASVYNLADVIAERPRRWHHRPAHADGGREYGNVAAFAFDADLAVLAREATQNSLDERYELAKPIRVRYTLHEVTGEHLEAFQAAVRWHELSDHFEHAASARQKVSRSLRAALDDLARDRRLLLLRIDDFNAYGLTGPEYDDGRYSAVVRRQLDSHKSDSFRAGGSYGLGKATLWASSRFGLVLINSTLAVPHEGHIERRVIGRLELPWRKVNGEAFAGPAWFGELDTEPHHKDIARSWWAEEQTVRDLYLDRATAEPGTSFLIVGAHDASGDANSLPEMHEKLVNSLADGFWAAMVGGHAAEPLMEASVVTLRNGQIVIPEQRVDPRERHPALTRALQAYLNNETVRELTSGEQVASIDVPLTVPPLRGGTRGGSKGAEHEAVLLLTPAADSDIRLNRVVCMRGNRMTVMERRPRELPLGAAPFKAVLLAGHATGRTGEDVALAEQFLRASEPPEHDRWGRTEELSSLYERGALSRLEEFRTEIDKAVRSLVGRRESKRGDGPAVLRELLRLDAHGQVGSRPPQGVATVRNVSATVEADGAWQVRVDLRLPETDDPWLLTPVAKFDVRSGGRPVVSWKLLTPAENCRIEGGSVLIDAGIRSATFTGVTDPSTHPVKGAYSRLVIDVQKARGGAE
ncbi:MAG: helix-turn-helix transcriptional regulator [Hamadaea sp.]|uniref:helix-turn-helix transcriptional regulator n=1 Tax=Hamadaea sp. TaxID=2024425 RepID=UPI0017FEF4AF|nr:helix-turn-helix transcriptional regulator [Hamadaea sp.]NUT19449.1 helix-turn-helix transcriptional regulator [Hamadaea sp.]